MKKSNVSVFGTPKVVEMYHEGGNVKTFPRAVTVKIEFFTGEPAFFTCAPEAFGTMIDSIGSRLLIGGAAHREVEVEFRREVDKAMAENTALRGVYFDRSGIHELRNGQHVYVLGDQVIGDFDGHYYITPDIARHHLMTGTAESFRDLLIYLSEAKPVVRMAYAYVLMSLLRDIIKRGYDLQGVLYIRGASGLGKSYLANKLCGSIVDATTWRCSIAVDAASSVSALRDAIAGASNLPLLVDDFCLSVSKETQSRRVEMGAQILREATSELPMTKKLPNGTVGEFYCNAGIIMTAEFDFENVSDANRCIFLPLFKNLDMPKELTPEMFGTGIHIFLEEFLRNYDTITERIEQGALLNLGKEISLRARKNLSAVYTVGELFAEVAYYLEPDLFDIEGCDLGFDEAIEASALM